LPCFLPILAGLMGASRERLLAKAEYAGAVNGHNQAVVKAKLVKHPSLHQPFNQRVL